MGALPVINNVHRVALNWVASSGQLAENVIHVRGVDTDPDAIFEYLDDNVTSNMWAVLCDSAHVESIDITPLDGTTATQHYVPTTAANWDGATGGQCVPAAACVVKLSTLSRGRSFRGRIFLPFVSESSMAEGKITSSDLPTMQTAWDTFLTTGTDPGPELVVASYKLSLATKVSGALVENALGTQRRRQERVRA